MPDFMPLTCPTCGGKLQITPDIERFVCTHCGNEHLVRRGAGIVSLAPVVDSMDALRRATDRTASELAIRRTRDEMAELESAVAAVEAQLVPLRAKLAEHDKWLRNARSMWWVLGSALLCGVGSLLVDADALGGSYQPTDPQQQLALTLFLMGVVSLLAWAVSLLLLHTVYAVRPPRGKVEAAIREIGAEIDRCEAAKLAKRAEIEQLLPAVRPRDPGTRSPSPSPGRPL